MDKMKVIIDTDPGTDDAMAVLMVLRQRSKVDVLAITTCHGNTNVRQASRNAVKILEVVDRLDVPVFVGASKSLLDLPGVRSSEFHGKDGFGDVAMAEAAHCDHFLDKVEDAHHAMLRLVNENKGEVIILCLGPLTNVATAVRVDPEFGKKLKDCIVMGGNYKGQGNVTPSAEFNFYKDPEAAHIVLTQLSCMISLITLELCYSLDLTWEYYDEIVGMNTNVSKFLKVIGSKMRKHSSSVSHGTFAWDQVAAAVLLHKEIVESQEHVCCQVELGGGLTRGQVVVDWRNNHKGSECNVKLITKINLEIFKKMIGETVNPCDNL